MITILPSSTLFSSLLLLSSLIVISAPHWFIVWVGLVLNLIVFTPLITQHHHFQEVESAVKYFLIQATASNIFLLGLLLLHYPLLTIPHSLILIAILIKLGGAPFHQWFPNTMAGLSWPVAATLLTWQKLAPIVILAKLIYPSSPFIIFFAAIISALTGSLGGLNQTHLRPLLAYSSIRHLGWIISSIIYVTITIFYFVIYVIINLALFICLWSLNSSKTKILRDIHSWAPPSQLVFILTIISLGGLPPLSGFYPKILVAQSLTINNPPLIIILIFSSLINLYFYLTITLSSLIPSNRSPSFFTAHRSYLGAATILIPSLLLPIIL